ncbi:MAG: GAF domain-containing protein [Actinobacteria bacterium]|nr:MAG: GAF domain-containing protein [Actinomycetota bacterium]
MYGSVMLLDVFRLAVLVAVASANIGLALVVYLRNSRNLTNRVFSAAAFVIACWLALDFLADQHAFSSNALLLRRANMGSSLTMGALLLYFALNFPQREERLSAAWHTYFAAGGTLVAITVLTDLVVSKVRVMAGSTNVVAGPLLPIYAIWALVGVASVVFILSKKYRRATYRTKAQLKFMLLGVALFALSSVLFGLLLPVLTGSYETGRLNMVSTLLLTGFTAYAMIKHRLMDIRLVVLRGAAYTILVATSGAVFVLLMTIMRASFADTFDVNSNALFFIAGLVVIFGFQPLRYLLERATDRLFFRRTYDPDSLLAELSVAMTSTVDLEDLARLIAERLSGKMRLTHAAVWYDSEHTPLMVSTAGQPSEWELKELRKLCERRQMIFSDELAAASQDAAILAQTQTRVLIPLDIDRNVIGALMLGPKQSGEIFTALDLQFLRILAPEAAISLKNAQLFAEKNQRVRELTALNQLAFALGDNIELDAVLNAALEQVVSVTKADSGSIMLLDKDGRTMMIQAARGIPADVVASTRTNVGEGIAGWVAETKEPLILVDGMDPRFKKELKREDIMSAITVPLTCKEKVIGVLSVNRKKSAEFFTKENLNVVTSFAGQLAVTIENAKLYGDLENTFMGTITALAAAVDAKDPHTFGHSNAVTAYAIAIAEKLGLSEEEVHSVRVASTLHDIGKIGIDGAILNKPAALSKEERSQINGHPTIGANILASLDFLQESVPLILFHHEYYGGGGYPSGISGDAIPIGARIISVADSYNAMVSDRPYRKAMSVTGAVEELKRNAGTQFDPDVVAAFLEVLKDEGHEQEVNLAGQDDGSSVRILRPTRSRTSRVAVSTGDGEQQKPG